MSEKLISEELKKIIPFHYELDRDKLEITRVDGVPVTIKDFEELATILPSSYQLDLADDKIVIMPVGAQTGRVTAWCRNNPRLVGLVGSSQTCYNLPLPNPTVRGPDASVVLATRFLIISFPSVAPNFVAEIRSDNDSEEYFHRKMLDYMNADVE
ncbi:15315_t:CDS:2, partial [Funneliformis geosporum]